MKFQYLGTAAAEGWPALFCNCDHCKRATAAGGRNIRTRSQAIIDDVLLIDFPSDTNYHARQNKLDLSACKYLLVTHPHIDHFSPTDLYMRSDSYYAHNLTSKTMQLISNQAVLDRWAEYNKIYGKEEPSALGIENVLLPLYTPTVFGKYTITALEANHSIRTDVYIYLISDGDKTVLYLHDTGLLYDEVWDYLVKNDIYCDFVSFDCTYVVKKSSGGHMGLDSCVETRDKLRELGLIDHKSKLCINHYSHNGELIHDELVPVAAELGFLTSYDGMVIAI